MTSPSGTAYMGGQRCPEEMRNSTRLWIWRDPSLPRDSWQPFIDWDTTQGRLSLPTADVLSTIVKRSMLTDVDKLPSCSRFSRLCSGFYRSKDPTNSIKVLKEQLSVKYDNGVPTCVYVNLCLWKYPAWWSEDHPGKSHQPQWSDHRDRHWTDLPHGTYHTHRHPHI